MLLTKLSLKKRLELMASTPQVQVKQLAIGTAISLISMASLILTSELELQWLFYLLSFILVLGILYAIPGYIGIWLWRMKDTLFKE